MKPTSETEFGQPQWLSPASASSRSRVPAAVLECGHLGGPIHRAVRRNVAADALLLMGRRPRVTRLAEAGLQALAGGRRPEVLTLKVPERSQVSRTQVLFWVEDAGLRAAAPAGAARVLVQPWGQAARVTPLASAPTGELLDRRTTLWLPPSGASPDRGRWRVAVSTDARAVEPAVPAGDTIDPEPIPELSSAQVSAVAARFAEYLRFPAATPGPAPLPFRKLPAHERKAHEHRLDAVRRSIANAGLPDVTTGADLLSVLVDRGLITPRRLSCAAAEAPDPARNRAAPPWDVARNPGATYNREAC